MLLVCINVGLNLISAVKMISTVIPRLFGKKAMENILAAHELIAKKSSSVNIYANQNYIPAKMLS
jgi:hypothetical protein